jgi:Cysteine rich repeat
MFVRNNLICAVCAAVFFSGAPVIDAASAQNIDITSLQRQPAVRDAMNACMADRSRLCADVPPGGGRIVRCLAARSQDLSAVCRSHMEKARDALVAAGIAVNPDHAQPLK